MKLNRLLALGLIVIGILFSGSSCPINAQISEAKIITAVKIEKNKAISSESILAKVKTKAGDPFNQEIVNEDLKRLYATDYFTDVSVDVRDEVGGVAGRHRRRRRAQSASGCRCP